MALKLCLNTATIRQAPFEEQFRVAHEAGFTGIGLWTEDIDRYLAGEKTLADVRALLAEHHLAVPEVSYLGDWQYGEQAEKARGLEEARRRCRITASLGCPMIGAVPSAEFGDLGEAATDYARLADVAAESGLAVGLEFYGSAKQMRGLDCALDVITRADRPNGGLLYDAFHFYLGDSAYEDIDRIPIEKLFMVHLSDAEDVSRERLFEYHKHRVPPGRGIGGIKRGLDQLAVRGYTGWYSVEIFNDDYLPRDPLELAQEARQAAEEVLA